MNKREGVGRSVCWSALKNVSAAAADGNRFECFKTLTSRT